MLSNKVMAIVNLNEDHINVRALIRHRPVASLPIAGRYRVIDFILSNITNANIFNVGVFSQRKTRSLNDHLGDGSSWDLDRISNGLFIFSNQYEINEKHIRGDIHSIYQNIDYIERSTQEYILIAAPYMIYNIDFKKVFQSHLESGAEITTLYKEVDMADRDFYDCHIYTIEDSKITSIGKNMCSRKQQNVSMDCVLMSRKGFLTMIYDSIEKGDNLYLVDAINQRLMRDSVNLYKFDGYLKCVNNTKSYRAFNTDILSQEVAEEIFKNQNGPIYTKMKDEAPTYFSSDSQVENSIIASGCIIEGKVKNSVIFRKVKIEKGTVVENSIIMQNSIIEENAHISHLICDKNTRVTHGKKLLGDVNMPIVVKKGETI